MDAQTIQAAQKDTARETLSAVYVGGGGITSANIKKKVDRSLSKNPLMFNAYQMDSQQVTNTFHVRLDPSVLFFRRNITITFSLHHPRISTLCAS